MEQFEDELHHLHLGMTTDYNWSIHEHDKVEDGGRFIKVLEPEWVAEDVAWAHREAARLYE